MLKNSFFVLQQKTVNPKLTKIDTVGRDVMHNIHTKFELNQMHCLDAVVSTLIHTCIYASS